MMSDTRLAMREFRFLDEKRKLTALSSSEERRWRELKQALGAPEPNAPARPQAPATAGLPDPGSAYPPEQNGHRAATGSVPPSYAPYTTPGYGQPPAMSIENPQPASPRSPPVSTLPAAELLGLSESPRPTQHTVADTGPASAAKVDSTPGEGSGDEVTELDPSEVTLLDAELEKEASHAAPQPIAPSPQPKPQPIARPAAPKPQSGPPLTTWSAHSAPQTKVKQPEPATTSAQVRIRATAQPQDEGAMIDLSASEAIDTGEFNIPEAPAEQPPAVLASAPAEAPNPPAAPAFSQPPVALEDQQSGARSVVGGEHRVIIHTHEGQVMRGVLRDVDVWAKIIALEQSGGPEQLPTEKLKAIFFIKAPGERDAPASGQKIRVTLADGRQVLGFSTDFDSQGPGFFLVPADVRTNTSRIYLFRAAVDAINPE